MLTKYLALRDPQTMRFFDAQGWTAPNDIHNALLFVTEEDAARLAKDQPGRIDCPEYVEIVPVYEMTNRG